MVKQWVIVTGTVSRIGKATALLLAEKKNLMKYVKS